MFIEKISGYVPHNVVTNAHFNQVNGLSEEWILSRTGIRERRKAEQRENTNTMAVKVVEIMKETAPDLVDYIDLIVGATYTPYDTIHTLAHSIQHHLNISDIPVISLSTACSSFINAMELAQGYFAMKKSRNALIVAADNNTAYNNEADQVSGHLWGDAASAVWVSQYQTHRSTFQILDIFTAGAGNIGKAHEGVVLRPLNDGFVMPFGKDVFLNACHYMAKASMDILTRNHYTIDDISFFVPHQANLRITRKVAESLNLSEDKVLSNIEYLGNTGCAGCIVALWENTHKIKKGDLIVMSVFGGGYSYGSMLLKAL